ncbi:MAG: murein biosynthesis integral membrane protein MurJ [Planctomycetota bacterium]
MSVDKPPSVLGAARIISSSIFLSRILGFVRDMLCAGFFGWAWDAFVVAFTIPNLFRRLFGEGALSSAFIPTFSHYLENQPHSETLKFINTVITILVAFLSIITLLVILSTFAFPILLPLILPDSYPPEFNSFFAELLRIMIPYLPIICLVAVLGALLNTLHHFTMPALASVVLNISWIGGFFAAVWLTNDTSQQLTIIAWFIIIGGLLEIIIQIPPLIKRKIFYSPRWQINHPGVQEIKRLIIPAIIGLAPFQINLAVDFLIAGTFVKEPGAISALYFANRLMQFPLALIGISLATAVFPLLSRYVARGEINSMKEEVTKVLRFSFFVDMPATIGLIVLAQPIIQLAFQVLPDSIGINAFSTGAVNRCSLVLICYSSALWAYAGSQIITRVFYAFKDMKTPARLSLYLIFLNLTLNLILVQFIQEAGIALATALTGIINFVILLSLLNKKVKISLTSSSVKSIIASLLMGGLCLWLLSILPSVNPETTDWSILKPALIRVFVPALAGLIFYFLISYFLQPDEVRKIIKLKK